MKITYVRRLVNIWAIRVILYYMVVWLALPIHVVAMPITPDDAAPKSQKSSMDETSNGVPVVNLAAPSGAGVSKNTFKDYNVDSQGVILNNSLAKGTTQLGGALYANPLYNGRAADIVLIEVSGTSKSTLQGYTEMFGNSAEFVLANPNGIYVNGAGFINIPRAALIAGTMGMSNETLTTAMVKNGGIEIGPNGLDGRGVQQLDLWARQLVVNGPIAGTDQLRMILGANQIGYAHSDVEALDSDAGSRPALSLDAKALGGMYAGRIFLMSTEKGVGVNTQGPLVGANGIDINSAGDVSYTEAGSNGRVAIDAQGSITQSKGLDAGSVSLNAGNDIVLNGYGVNGRNGIDVSAGGSLIMEGTEEFPVYMLGKTVDLRAGKDIVGSYLRVGGGDRLTVSADRDIKIGQGVAQATSVDIKAIRTFETTSMNMQSGGLRVQSGQIQTTDTYLYSAGDAEISADGEIVQKNSKCAAGTSLQLNGGSLIQDVSSMVGSDGHVALQLGALTNHGTILSGGDLDIRALALDNAGKIAGAGVLGLVGDSLTNTGLMLGFGGVEMTSKAYLNLGEIASGRGLSLVSDTVTDHGMLSSREAMSLSGLAHNWNGASIQSGGTLNITTSQLAMSNTQVVSEGGASINAIQARLTFTDIHSRQPLTFDGTQLDIDRSLVVGEGAITLASDHIVMTGSTVIGQGDVGLSATTFGLQNGSLLQAAGALSIRADHVNATDSQWASQGKLNFVANDATFRNHTLQGLGEVAINADTLTTEGSVFLARELRSYNKTATFTSSRILSVGNLSLDGQVDAGGSFFWAGSNLNVQSPLLKSTQSMWMSEGDIALSGGDMAWDEDTIQGSQRVGIFGKTVTLSTTQVLGNTLSINADMIHARDGMVYGGTLQTESGTLESLDTQWISQGDLLLLGKHALNLSGTAVMSMGRSTLEGTSITLAGNMFQSAGDIYVRGGRVASTGDDLFSKHDISWLGDTSSLTGTQLTGLSGVHFSGGTLDTNGAWLQSGGALELQHNHVRLHDSGIVSSGSMVIRGTGNRSSLALTNTTLRSGATVSADAVDLTSDMSAIFGNAIAMNADELNAHASLFSAEDQLTFDGRLLTFSDTVHGANHIQMTGNDVSVLGNSIMAMGDITVAANALKSDTSDFAAHGNVALTGHAIAVLNSGIQSQSQIRIQSDQLSSNGSQILALDDVLMTGLLAHITDSVVDGKHGVGLNQDIILDRFHNPKRWRYDPRWKNSIVCSQWDSGPGYPVSD